MTGDTMMQDSVPFLIVKELLGCTDVDSVSLGVIDLQVGEDVCVLSDVYLATLFGDCHVVHNFDEEVRCGGLNVNTRV